jgi:hypothetical protein
MKREIGVLVETPDHLQDTVYVVESFNAATAKGHVSNVTGVPRNELRFVQLERVDA